MWGQADIAQQEFLEPLHKGYHKDKDGQLKPVTADLPPAPEAKDGQMPVQTRLFTEMLLKFYGAP